LSSVGHRLVDQTVRQHATSDGVAVDIETISRRWSGLSDPALHSVGSRAPVVGGKSRSAGGGDHAAGREGGGRWLIARDSLDGFATYRGRAGA
jgi:hypothetical protein